jgi:DNA-binding transcriptional ArsR family regulator
LEDTTDPRLAFFESLLYHITRLNGLYSLNWISLMSPDPDILLAPKVVAVDFSLEPVHNVLASLFALILVDQFSGLDEWVEQTATALTLEQMRTNRLVSGFLSAAFEPQESWGSFPAFLENVAAQDSHAMRDRVLTWLYDRTGGEPDPGFVLEDLETFLERVQRLGPDKTIDRDLHTEAYALLGEPPALQNVVVSHLRAMWEQVLSAEWERRKPLLQQVVDAFKSRDYSGLTAYEAIRVITGRDLQGGWQWALSRAERLVFIPSTHVGPYLIKIAQGPLLRIVFGARVPSGVDIGLTELTRAELLLRLRALADDVRLRILELLVEHGELCAQEIIPLLNLSQSGASRHLSQLSATGYLVEHHRGGKTKCYTINPDRFRDTLRAIARYVRIDLR